MTNSEPDMRGRATDPSTPISELLELLLDFPGDVLRNPAFVVAVAADPAVVRGLDLPRRAILALDADYRPIGMATGAEEFRRLLEMCDRRNGSKFRFAPADRLRHIQYEPIAAEAPKSPPREVVSTLRFACALSAALIGQLEGWEFCVYARHPADGDYYIEGEIRSCLTGQSERMPGEVCEAFRWLFRDYAGFELRVHGNGLEADLTLLERADFVDLSLTKRVRKADPGACFEVEGRPAACGDPAALLEAIRSLESVVPKRGNDEIVLVVDDTDGSTLDIGVNVMSLCAEDAVEGSSFAEFLGSHGVALEDLSDELGLEDADRLQVNAAAISQALDRVHQTVDPVFEHGFTGEFLYRLAAFRNGRLIAFHGDRWEVQREIASASLRCELPPRQ